MVFPPSDSTKWIVRLALLCRLFAPRGGLSEQSGQVPEKWPVLLGDSGPALLVATLAVAVLLIGGLAYLRGMETTFADAV